ncbi:phosphotransferase [Virgibacillus natechei]|uniref:phosphotransferase n=1 Tax=Virgibacillus sp. CBA3643 TaxID=2942278 RepID=UPI0035A2AF34
MNRFKQGDEFRYRLSSFLSEEGNLLPLERMSFIKASVFLIQTVDNEKLILKRHSKKDNVNLQWHFFEQIGESNAVPFKRYPNGRKIISRNNYYWTITPFIKGEKLNYNLAADRLEAVKALKEFHHSAKNIHINNGSTGDYLFTKWYQRLLLFKKTASIFKEFGFENLYKDIVQTTVIHLRHLTEFPWKSFELAAESKGEWIHGDVASHNFLRQTCTHVIDFDLLKCTTQLYDYIQLGQRFLPYINWDPDKLLAYQMVQEKDVKAWIYAVCIPVDVMREWLHYLHEKPVSGRHRYLSTMEERWIKRSNFVKNSKLMLKSM